MIMVLFLAVLISGWGLVAPLGAAPVPAAHEGVVAQARQELSRENYEEAQVLLNQAWQSGVRTPEAAFLLGRTYHAMLNFKDARWYLQEAVRLRPGYQEAQLLLAETLVGLNQPAQALPILKELEASGYQPGRTAFVQGLAYQKDNNFKQAAQSFRKAQVDPKLAQEAKVQEAMALSADNRLRDAKQTMAEAIGLNPDSATAGFAQGYAAILDRRLKDYQRFRFNLYGGFDYDSNVSLQPGTSAGFVPASGKNDVFWSLSAAAEYNIMKPGPMALWAFYGYYQNFHHKLTNFDLWSNTAGVVPSYTWSKARFWMPFAFNFSEVGYQPYLTSYSLSPTYLYLVKPKIGVEAGMQLAYQNYWFGAYFDEDQRSGSLVGGSLAGYYFIKEQEGYLQLRFTYLRNFTNGSNWDNSSYRFGLAGLYPFNENRTKIKASVDFISQPYDNIWFNGVPLADNPKRNDNIFIGGLDITHKLFKDQKFEINAHVYYVNSGSNIALYTYDRLITGVQFGYRY
ncbi:MAG: tetratricopeptide repeat protein [Desulfobaccales bacterium]